MKFGSLFAGIGGIDLGLEWAGMECVWQVENDDYCSRVLEKHWPDVERFEDVRKVGKENLAPVDLIAGGFPCQPHSVAGKRKGAEDDRNLWPEFRRIVAELRPRYILAENVPGIVTTYIDTVLSDLESEGYSCATFNLPAVAFDAPHRRERIFVIAALDDTKGRRRGFWQAEDIGTNTRNVYASSDTGAIQPSNVADTTIKQCNGGDDNRRGRCEPLSESRDSVEEARSVSSWWTTEPNVGRVAHGFSSRVDRLRGLGNAVVPQVAEWVGKRIIEFAHS